MDNRTKVMLGGTRSEAVGFNGSQVFPTQRALGGRALLCDTFERAPVLSADVFEPTCRLACGLKVHRDGDNALYGDGHAAWYGDPQMRIPWWPVSDYGMPWDVTMSSSGTAVHYILNAASLYTSIIYTKPQYHSAESRGALMRSHCVWHQMDEAAGVDAGGWYKYKE